MKNDALKKHHFWILFGLSFLFVALALVFMMTKVSTAIASGQKENDDQVAKVKATNPPGKGVIDGLDEQKGMLDKMKDKLWEKNWTLQEKYFTWPNHPQNLFKRFEKLKFGTDIDQTYSDFEHEQMKLRTVYQASYEEAASRITPTQFGRGSWQNVLRWVSVWGDRKAQSKQMWLVMEDLWIQRALLDPISMVNKQIASFAPVPGPDSKPLKQTFRSRVWELQLEVIQGGPTGWQMKVLLKNRTPQLQILGKGNRMLVNVWLDERVQVPFTLPIEGAFIPGNSEYPAPERDAQGREKPADPLLVPITPGISITKLARVELQQDVVSVPVRSLEQVVLGYSSDKQSQLMAKETKTLEPPKFWGDDPDAMAAGGAPGMPGAMGSPGEGPGMPGGGIPGGGKMGMGGPDAGGGGGAMGMGGGSSMAMATATSLMGATNANRKRYMLINDQIRRMPVAFTLVCDQMYIQDVLIAYANSPLRFEAVQYHWRRQNRPMGSGGSGGFGAPGMDDASGGGEMIGGYASNGLMGSFGGGKGGRMGMGSPDAGGPGGMPGMAPPSGSPGMGSSSGMPGMAPPGGMPGMGSPGGMPGADMGFGSGFGGFGSGFGGFGGSLFSTISDAQSNAGLVELTVYGIISIYEKYEVKPEGGEAAPAGDAAPGAAAPAAPAAAPATPGAAPATPGAAPATPGAAAPATPGAAAPATPGAAPATPGATPGAAPATPGAAPATPGAAPATPGK